MVIGILAVESYFRTPGRRAIECAAWLLLSLLGMERARRVSVGIAQVRVHRWVDAGIVAEGARIKAIASFLSVERNYDACQAALGQLFSERPTEYLDVAQHYHGARSPYYAWLLRLATMLLGLGEWSPDLGVSFREVALLHVVENAEPPGEGKPQLDYVI